MSPNSHNQHPEDVRICGSKVTVFSYLNSLLSISTPLIMIIINESSSASGRRWTATGWAGRRRTWRSRRPAWRTRASTPAPSQTPYHSPSGCISSTVSAKLSIQHVENIVPATAPQSNLSLPATLPGPWNDGLPEPCTCTGRTTVYRGLYLFAQ